MFDDSDDSSLGDTQTPPTAELGGDKIYSISREASNKIEMIYLGSNRNQSISKSGS